MKKIPSLFQRNYESDRLVRDEVVPGCEWVLNGEGIATRKWNGSCCMVRGGQLFKRYDAKKGRVPPDGFESAQDLDPATGHQPGWLPVGDGPEDKWFRAALSEWIGSHGAPPPDGTYEAVGTHFQGNAECRSVDMLEPHGKCRIANVPRNFVGLRAFFETTIPPFEGIVWHHPDGRAAKIKKKDFGLK